MYLNCLNVFNADQYHSSMIFRLGKCFLFIFCIVLLFSCASRPESISMTEISPMPAKVNRVELAKGDQVELRFAYAPEFNETQTIRPDGKLELLLLGEIDAAGKTPSDLRDELIKLYSKHLAHPELALMTRLSLNQRIYVGGAVRTPGVMEMHGTLTAMEAIMGSGGFLLPSAETRNVIVVRFKGDARQSFSLDLQKSLSENNSTPFYLEPKDIVYVPRTHIAEVAQWVDQNLWRIIPIRFGTIGYDFNNN